MSANHEDRDGYTSAPGPLNKMQAKMLEGLFEAQVDYDIAMYHKDKKDNALLKRLCLTKIILFPIQYPLVLFILGWKWAKDVYVTNKLNWLFLLNKIDRKQFNAQMLQTAKDMKAGL